MRLFFLEVVFAWAMYAGVRTTGTGNERIQGHYFAPAVDRATGRGEREVITGQTERPSGGPLRTAVMRAGRRSYLTSTSAPASVSCCFRVSASSFDTPSFSGFGA